VTDPPLEPALNAKYPPPSVPGRPLVEPLPAAPAPAPTAPAARTPLSRDEYLSERKELYKYQQENWASFEKTLLTLSAAFLGFSMSFLGFLANGRPPGTPIVSPGSESYLLLSWITLSISIAALLGTYPVNIKAYTFEIIRIEDALVDTSALDRVNPWVRYCHILYGVSVAAFFGGVALLGAFCRNNFSV
jgi:hypothetical protein